MYIFHVCYQGEKSRDNKQEGGGPVHGGKRGIQNWVKTHHMINRRPFGNKICEKAPSPVETMRSISLGWADCFELVVCVVCDDWLCWFCLVCLSWLVRVGWVGFIVLMWSARRVFWILKICKIRKI